MGAFVEFDGDGRASVNGSGGAVKLKLITNGVGLITVALAWTERLLLSLMIVKD